MSEKPRSNYGTIDLPRTVYGTSVAGIPLEYFGGEGDVELVIFAGIHGEEPETTALLSKALRSVSKIHESVAVILAANPDGLIDGTRGNRNGIELNRNFPASNWSSELVKHEWKYKHGQEIPLSTGSAPGSEPEIVALVDLMGKLTPKIGLAIHAPLGCVNERGDSKLGAWLAKESKMPIVKDLGYATPGSFGSWASENGIYELTYELPPESVWSLLDTHLPLFQKLFEHGIEVVN